MNSFCKEVITRIKKYVFGWLSLKPHFVVGGKDNPYLLRYYLIPRNPICNCYLHCFLRDDDDRALHDHPWRSLSILLKGSYTEITFTGYTDPNTGERELERRKYYSGSIIPRFAGYAHRVELDSYPNTSKRIPTWTLFITGPVVREWGFHCPSGWKHWKDFTNFKNTGTSGETGKGCDS
jgi:hypothetical protein